MHCKVLAKLRARLKCSTALLWLWKKMWQLAKSLHLLDVDYGQLTGNSTNVFLPLVIKSFKACCLIPLFLSFIKSPRNLDLQ